MFSPDYLREHGFKEDPWEITLNVFVCEWSCFNHRGSGWLIAALATSRGCSAAPLSRADLTDGKAYPSWFADTLKKVRELGQFRGGCYQRL